MSWGAVDSIPLNLGVLGYGIAALAFGVLSILLAIGWRRRLLGAWLLGACIVTALWAGLGAYNAILDSRLESVVQLAELLRSAAWISFLLAILSQLWKTAAPLIVRVGFPWLMGTFAVFVVGMEIAGFGVGASIIPGTKFDLAIFSRLILAVFGLLLVENLFSSPGAEHRWAVKYLCFGVGAIFCYDFFLYSDALLFQRVNNNLLEARGFTNAIVVPLIAISAARNREWSLEVFVSRQVIFHSATLIGAGAYLLVMAGAGMYLRQFGGEWGPAVQAMFLVGAILLLLIVSFSESFRARTKVFISKHFFSNKYDYREEWLRFIDTISSLETQGGLPQRVVEAIAEIVECTEGTLWLRQERDHFVFAAAWNRRLGPDSDRLDPSFVQFLEQRNWVVDLDEITKRPEIYAQMVLPRWLTQIEGAWLFVPLLHHKRLVGILLLGRPRVRRNLNWEDLDLLKTVGRQAASYLAEQQAAKALAESRQFDQFNRRFAFVIHDIKNLVSQLSLMVNNAQKHRDNPEFQDDMLATVRESVEKMKLLMSRMHEGGKEVASIQLVDLAAFLRRSVAQASVGPNNPAFDCQSDSVAVVADEERLSAVVAHVIDNALDASSASHGSAVVVRLVARGADAVIEVEDDGPGMSPEFIRDELFRPFATTKGEGFGIGAFESREYVRELGGTMDVISEPGSGTIIRIILPAVSVEATAAHPETNAMIQ